MDPADLIEENSEHIDIRYCHYLMDHPDIDMDRLKTIQEFVAYCHAKDQKDLDVPRAPDGKSFRERREETPGWWKKEMKNG